MSELVISKDFLSKENTTYLYKTIITSNELDNITKVEKEKLLKDLIDIMKKKYKLLKLPQINKDNIIGVRKQFNDMCIKDIKITPGKEQNLNHDRKFNRDFNTIKKTVTISERPLGQDMKDSTYGAAPKNSRDMNQTTSIADRLKELEDSRRVESKGITVTPDFLKPIKVGKSDQIEQVSNTPSKLLGYGEEESNFKSTSSNSDKYNSSMSIQERLAQIEKERQVGSPSTSNTNITAVFDQNNSNIQYNNLSKQIPTDQYQQPSQPSYQQPSQPSYQQLSQPSYQQSPQQQPPQSPQQQQYQQQPQQQQQQPQQQPQQQLSQQPLYIQLQNENNSLLKALNEMKTEIEYLKQLKKQFNKKSLQLEINKTDSFYKYVFNKLDNILNMKLVSYYLPQPVYNIIEDLTMKYSIDEIENTLHVKRGYYTIEKLLTVLNTSELVFSLDDDLKVNIKTDNKPFKFQHCSITKKLGFIQSSEWSDVNQTISASNLYDLRLPTKLYLYIQNLQEQPVGILNFNGSSICDLNFNIPISLDLLDIKFTTEDGIKYNFNGINYNLSFQIDIIDS